MCYLFPARDLTDTVGVAPQSSSFHCSTLPNASPGDDGDDDDDDGEEEGGGGGEENNDNGDDCLSTYYKQGTVPRALLLIFSFY